MQSSNDTVTGEQTRYTPGGSGEEMVTISSISSPTPPPGGDGGDGGDTSAFTREETTAMQSSNDTVTGEQTRYTPGGSGEEMVTISSISSTPGPTGPATPPASCPQAGDPNHEPDLCAVCFMAVRARAERKN